MTDRERFVAVVRGEPCDYVPIFGFHGAPGVSAGCMRKTYDRLRATGMPDVGGCWDLTRFRNYVLKAGGRVAKHSRRLIVHLAQPVIRFWQRLLDRVTSWRLRPRFPLPRGPTRRAWRQPPRHAHLVEVLRD